MSPDQGDTTIIFRKACLRVGILGESTHSFRLFALAASSGCIIVAANIVFNFMSWKRSDVIATIGLFLSLISIIAIFINPELRFFLGLQSELCEEDVLVSKKTGICYEKLSNFLEN